MAVVRLRTRRDAKEQIGLEALRGVLQDMAAIGTPSGVVGRLVAVVERELASRRGWGFVMVEPNLNAEVVAHLAKHSRRKLTAVQLWARLFESLPPDSNEVLADRSDLARAVGCSPAHLSEIMRGLEALGAVSRRKEAGAVRSSVPPRLGTHLPGAVRDGPQADAPPLKLRLVD